MQPKKLGIFVGGGPAPGINAVIGSATIEAINQGFTVVGFYQGFQWICSDSFDPGIHTINLDIPHVARIHFEGGSILRTSRANLLDNKKLKSSTYVSPDDAKVEHVYQSLKKMGITHLLTIGGDDTALSSRFLAERAGGELAVVHVPKTIDNDLPLPYDISTFGYATARYVGTKIVQNLMKDSRTTGRWYLVVAMGRTAGWLAMGLGASAGATLTMIPEEFKKDTSIAEIANVLEGSILKRRIMGRNDGVAIVAEGLAYRLGDRAELERLLGREVPVDAAGHVRLSEVPLGEMVKKELESRFAARGDSFRIVNHTLGYELRSADPTPGDIAYCRSLGYSSVRMLLRHQLYSGAMVSLVNGHLVPISFQELVDPKTNRIRTRSVDVTSDTYRVARAYMIRLERSDLENPEMLSKLAAEAKMTPDEFFKKYEQAATRLVDGVPVFS